MHLSKRFMPAVQPIKAGLFITAIAAGKAVSTGRRNSQ